MPRPERQQHHRLRASDLLPHEPELEVFAAEYKRVRQRRALSKKVNSSVNELIKLSNLSCCNSLFNFVFVWISEVRNNF